MAIIKSTKPLRLRSVSLQTTHCSHLHGPNLHLGAKDQSRETATKDSSATNTATSLSSCSSSVEDLVNKLVTSSSRWPALSSAVIRPQNSFVRRHRPASLTSLHDLQQSAAGDYVTPVAALHRLRNAGRIYAPMGALPGVTVATNAHKTATDGNQQTYSYLRALKNCSNVFISSGPRGCRLILPLQAASVRWASRGSDAVQSPTTFMTTTTTMTMVVGSRCGPIYPAMAISKMVPLLRFDSRLPEQQKQLSIPAGKELNVSEGTDGGAQKRQPQVINISSSSEIFEVAVHAGD